MKIVWLKAEGELDKRKGKDEVGAWWCNLDVPSNCCILPERRIGKYVERWGK